MEYYVVRFERFLKILKSFSHFQGNGLGKNFALTFTTDYFDFINYI